MIEFITNIRRNRAINDYVVVLGVALNKRYSPQEQFTVKQIDKTISDLGLSKRFTGYAIAMYRHQESVNTLSLYRIDQKLLNQLREDIASWFFDGWLHYRAQDVVHLGKSRGWKGGSPNKWVADQARIGAYHR